MKTFIQIIGMTLCLAALSCKSEPLPPQPSLNAVISYSMPAGNDAQFVIIDSLAPSLTNGWATSTNWQSVAVIPVVPGQTDYAVTNALAPGSMVIAWSTNAVCNSPWDGPVVYQSDPIKTTRGTLNVQ